MVEQQKSLLGGYRVLDLTDEKGFLCGKTLGDLGANVIKVESPGGDPARSIGPFYKDIPDLEKSLYWFAYNLNKRGITLNIETADGGEIFKRLVKTADFVIESFDSGYMDRLGLGYSELEKVNPRVIMTSISNFGQTGPYRDFKASEIVLCGMGSEMYSCGVPEREPLKLGGTVVQYQAGNVAAVATMTALFAARDSGVGDHVDLSIMEVHLGSIDRRSTMLVFHQYTSEVHSRVIPTLVSYPMGVRMCKDGFFDIWGGGIVQAFTFVVDWMGMPELMEQFGSVEAQMNPEKEAEFDAIFLPWCLERNKLEIWETAQKARVKLGPINTTEDLLRTPHFHERGFWVEMDHPAMGKVTCPGAPYKMCETPWQVNRPAPLLGQHNEEVYSGIGYSGEDIVKLKEIGVI